MHAMSFWLCQVSFLMFNMLTPNIDFSVALGREIDTTDPSAPPPPPQPPPLYFLDEKCRGGVSRGKADV